MKAVPLATVVGPENTAGSSGELLRDLEAAERGVDYCASVAVLRIYIFSRRTPARIVLVLRYCRSNHRIGTVLVVLGKYHRER